MAMGGMELRRETGLAMGAPGMGKGGVSSSRTPSISRGCSTGDWGGWASSVGMPSTATGPWGAGSSCIKASRAASSRGGIIRRGKALPEAPDPSWEKSDWETRSTSCQGSWGSTTWACPLRGRGCSATSLPSGMGAALSRDSRRGTGLPDVQLFRLDPLLLAPGQEIRNVVRRFLGHHRRHLGFAGQGIVLADLFDALTAAPANGGGVLPQIFGEGIVRFVLAQGHLGNDRLRLGRFGLALLPQQHSLGGPAADGPPGNRRTGAWAFWPMRRREILRSRIRSAKMRPISTISAPARPRLRCRGQHSSAPRSPAPPS